MGFTTFSGPLRLGTVKEGASRNTGLPLQVQYYTIPVADMTLTAATRTLGRLPAGAKIAQFTAEITTAIATAANLSVSFGVGGGSATQYSAAFNTGTAAGRVAQATVDSALTVANTQNVGTADVAVTVTSTAVTAAATAGVVVVGVWYIQRESDGSVHPAASL